MKKHISPLLVSALLVVSLSACSLTKNETTPTPESMPVVIEDIPSQDITQDAPEGFVIAREPTQQELENDPIIANGFSVAGSCTNDTNTDVGKYCVDVSDDTIRDFREVDCTTGGGQWQKTACDERLYQEKFTSFTYISDKNGVTTKKVYHNYYGNTGREILKK